ncbi:MAG: lipopolysaccharide biosynthesis protein [Betaproteobacteria bacterium]|nr:lipopolysaccharide biosynthesis protein [Gammaproteobacteria bacterium]MDH3436813.1 lipopolysaccharide biosynthesis protein [Betaproteobacteria bacterium]
MSLRQKVLSGLIWTSGTRLLGQIVTWAITIVVIRLLSPSDYGLLAMATVFLNFLIHMSEGGLGAALVQAPEGDDLKLRGVFGAVILFHSALFVLLVGAAPTIGQFFEEDHLVLIIRVLALQLLIAMFGIIPSALLTRMLDFKRLSIVALTGALCGSLSTLGLALSGYGVWALVVGSLITSLWNTVAINVLSPFLKWPDFSLRGTRKLITFGAQLTAARALWMVYSQADIFIAGKLLGRELLGFYSVAMHLASLPVQRISVIINQVAFPAFARTQDDPVAVSKYLLKTLRVLGFLAFPVLWGVSSIAPEIVAVLLGPKWEVATIPLYLLPLVMPLSLLSTFLNTAIQGIGRSGVVFMNVLTACLVMPGAFWIGAHWGLFGLCVAWVLGFPLVLIVNLRRMLPLVALRLRDVLAALAPAVLTSAGMYAAVSIARYLAADGLGAPVRMALLIGVGAASYGALVWTANRAAVYEIVELFSLERVRGKFGRSKTQ